MGNQWFRFKQFEIQQDSCAMKVGTDGVILGAWTKVEKAVRALDIGTGTGLLALMLAQRDPAIIVDAIEIEKESASQAAFNFEHSKFSDRLKAFEISFMDFCREPISSQYDLIICNPPYFSDSYRAPDPGRSLARHDDSLSLEDLFEGSVSLLAPGGTLSIVLPSDLAENCMDLAMTYSLYPRRLLHIKPTPTKEEKRTCLELRSGSIPVIHETLVIEEGRHK